jgi:hypothetical protein
MNVSRPTDSLWRREEEVEWEKSSLSVYSGQCISGPEHDQPTTRRLTIESMVHLDFLVEAGALEVSWGLHGCHPEFHIVLPVFPFGNGPTEDNGNTLLVPSHKYVNSG